MELISRVKILIIAIVVCLVTPNLWVLRPCWRGSFRIYVQGIDYLTGYPFRPFTNSVVILKKLLSSFTLIHSLIRSCTHSFPSRGGIEYLPYPLGGEEIPT